MQLNQQAVRLTKQFNTSLKELGDLTHWMKEIEKDLTIIHTLSEPQ